MMESEHHLLVINRTGSGEVIHFPLNEDHTEIIGKKPTTEEWEGTERVKDFGVAVLHNKLYILGGYHKTDKKYLNRVMCLDPVTGEWTTKTSMPTPRARFATTVIEDRIYVAGGERGTHKYTSATESYNPATNTWVKSGLFPEGRIHHGMSHVGSFLCSSGGSYLGAEQTNIWLYERHCWINLDEDYPQCIQRPTCKHTMLTIDDKLYFIGGVISREDRHGKKIQFLSRYVESFRPIVPVTEEKDREEDGDEETVVEDAQDGQFGLQGDLICPWELHPYLPKMSHGRHSAGAVVLGSKICVFGGCDLEGESVRQAEYIDLETRKCEDGVFIKKGNVSDVVCAILSYTNVEAVQANYELQMDFITGGMLSMENGEAGSKDGERGKWKGRRTLVQPARWIMW